jgi:tetratricopeptide (TPR) repeat protein
MPPFALVVTRTESDPEVDRLISHIRGGLGEERGRALDDLVDYANRANSADVRNSVGLGFHLAGLHDQATRIFDSLVREFPNNDHYRLNLATSLSQTAQVELCRLHLRHLAEHGSTEQIRKEAHGMLRGYEDFVGLSDRNRELRERQLASLSRAIQSPDRTVDSFLNLASLLHREALLDPSSEGYKEAAAVLEQGREAFPDEPRILELLIACYLRQDPEGRIGVAMADLERIAPHSPVLRILRDTDDDTAREFSERNARRAAGLMASVCERENPSAVREAALRDLGTIVAMYPSNPHYRVSYAFALMGFGRKPQALAEALKLDQLPEKSHAFHFNLGQVFWICGDAERGRCHLNLALKYARDDGERADARDRIAKLERTP